MSGTLLLAGLVTIALGGALSAARRTFTIGLTVQAVGALCVTIAGFWMLAGDAVLGAEFGNGLRPRLGVDGLSALFLATMGLIAAPASMFSTRYLARDGRGRAVGVLMAAFLLVLALVCAARDPVTFLAGWELMTLLPAGVILVARRCDGLARRTAFTYLAITHLGGVGTWVAILLLARNGLLDGTGAGVSTGSGLQLAIATAALIGMGTKAGVMPLHVWLPRAHPVAPAPVSALMSGVMIKIAIYALVRVLVEWLGVLPAWFGVLVLGVGALSAVGGVVYAIFQHDLKRLLALHSIENIGIIVLGIGACLLLRTRGEQTWAALALAAALLHTVNHAIFKALLFLGAGAFEKAAGTLRLDRLGGLLKPMPWTGGAFLVGAAAIAGLPPLNGFVSEWSTMQALLRVTGKGEFGDGLAGALALAALAATAALALLCFVKVIGLVLLGPSRHDTTAAVGASAQVGAVGNAAGGDSSVPSVRGAPIREAPIRKAPIREASAPMAGAMVFLALGCVALGLAPGVLFGTLAGLAPFGPAAQGTEAAQVGLRLPGTGSFPSLGLVVVLVVATAVLARLRGRRSAAPAPSWTCGQRVEPQLNWTSSGFTKPLRLVLEGVLRPRREITVREQRGVVQEITYRGHVPQLIDDRVYRPLARVSTALAARARRLQMGSLGVYIGYLIGLVVLLLGAARIGLFA